MHTSSFSFLDHGNPTGFENFGSKFPKFRPPPACSHLARNFWFFAIFCEFGQILFKFIQNQSKFQIISAKNF